MFLYSRWCSLPISKRQEIAAQFGIEKKGPTEVFSNTIKSDGYLVADIDAALTVSKLQEKLETDISDMEILWDYLVNGKPQPIIEVAEPVVEINPTEILKEIVDVLEPTPTPVVEVHKKQEVIRIPPPKKTYYKSKKK